MIEKTFVCSPKGKLFSSQPLVHPFQRYRATVSFGFILLSIVLSISSASAQTRAKRAVAKPEERSRRVDEQKPASIYEEVKQTQLPSQVRKTALTYPTRMGNESAERPALVNDIVIISRADDVAPARKLGARKAGVPANVPSIWPVVGPLRSGVGIRSNPFGGSGLETHKGQDISAPMGTPVKAAADGSVVIAGWQKGYGWVVYIDHGNGISTRYGHLSRIDVTVGQMLKQGEQLGLVGSTGRSTGPHLHYEVRINGQPTSPIHYLPALPPTAATTPAQ
jgi:murein DD-endopeptidase MepM/ murein hydrolase activator NlpD